MKLGARLRIASIQRVQILVQPRAVPTQLRHHSRDRDGVQVRDEHLNGTRRVKLHQKQHLVGHVGKELVLLDELKGIPAFEAQVNVQRLVKLTRVGVQLGQRVVQHSLVCAIDGHAVEYRTILHLHSAG